MGKDLTVRYYPPYRIFRKLKKNLILPDMGYNWAQKTILATKNPKIDISQISGNTGSHGVHVYMGYIAVATAAQIF